jgi:peptide chain release factor subunit 3
VIVRIKGIEEDDVQEGFVLSYPDVPCKRSKYFEAQVVILDLLEHKPLITAGYEAIFHVHVLAVECVITHLITSIDKKTGQPNPNKPKFLKSNDYATIRIKTEQSIAIEEFKSCPPLGRFTIRDEGKTIAIGKITKVKEE